MLRNTIGLENYINLTERLRSNPFISKLLESKISKAYQEVNEDSEHYASKPYLYVEEIIVDMNASVRSGNWKVFADRYDVDVNDIPVELKRKANNIIIKAYDAMRRAFKTVLDIMNGNKPVTDAQVRAYVDSLGTLNQRGVFNVDPEIMTDIARGKGYNSVDEMYKR